MTATPVLALSVGEPAGIGPDVVAMVAAAPPAGCRLVAIGAPDVLSARAHALGLMPEFVAFDPEAPPPTRGMEVVAVPTALPVTAGQVDTNNAASVLACLDEALDGCLAGRYDAMVTAPVHKGVINDAGIQFSGHTEYLATRCGDSFPVMMLATGGLRVALVTTHLPLRAVADAITPTRIERTSRTLVTDLHQRFGIENPRVLVCGLNPHAGEGGHLGREELEAITPVLERLRGEGLALIGPLPADTLFTPECLREADAVLAMYHDQGLPVLKHTGFGQAINVTLGLRVIRTSVDHGTALELAGTGQARDDSLRGAIAMAVDLIQRDARSQP